MADEADPDNVLTAKYVVSGRLIALMHVGLRGNWEELNHKLVPEVCARRGADNRHNRHRQFAPAEGDLDGDGQLRQEELDAVFAQFVAFSCKQRCACPSCHQKRTLMTGIHVAEEVCFPVAHRQVVFTIPKRLRIHARFDRKLLGKLSSCAWTCIKAEVQRMLGERMSFPA